MRADLRKTTNAGLIMNSSKSLLGVCGLYCGACYHYRASFPESEHLLKDARRQGRVTQGFTCSGCRSEILYIHPGCADCSIRDCAERRDILHCGLCSEFPCDRIRTFQNDGRIHHLDVVSNLETLKLQGADQWLAEQQKRWRCACGTGFSWYEKSCHNCGEELNSYRSGKTMFG